MVGLMVIAGVFVVAYGELVCWVVCSGESGGVVWNRVCG